MLTARQQQILQLIVQLYGEHEEPIGSKTLLNQSYLEVSPATIRNDMLALERIGYLKKAHSSSGRIPSYDGYKYYVDWLIDQHEEVALMPQESERIQSLFQGNQIDAMQHTRLLADILGSLTGYTAVVLGESSAKHQLDEFRLIPLTPQRVVALILTDNGDVESEVFDLSFSLSVEAAEKLTQLINHELKHLSIIEAQQRLKLTLPLMIQRVIGYQVDFSPIITTLLRHLKGDRYYVSGKNNLFDSVDLAEDTSHLKQLFNLVDGSSDMLNLLDTKPDGLAVEFTFGGLQQVSLVTASCYYQTQRFVFGLIGPSTMPYHRVIALMAYIIDALTNY